MSEFYVRKSCRLCSSNDLELVLSLKKSPLCDAYVKERIEQKLYDLNVLLCKNCRFVQISTIINPEYIYANYCKDQILNGQTPKPGSYRGRLNTEPENNRKTLLDIEDA